MESVLELRPIQVTVLPQGAFSSYVAQRRARGVRTQNLNPPHINPTDEVLSMLSAPGAEVEAAAAAETERATA
jgi:hypothetical protein